jgi:2-polyprenyl-3-methyl-5-hydroxy-6-metoxy-1,4-benzoquinol methylase
MADEATRRGIDRQYRSEVYGRYASVVVPSWLDADSRANEVWAMATLHRLRGWLPEEKSARCLDLGCGAGHLLQALRSAGFQNLWGVDVGPQAVAIARKKGLNATLGDLRDYLQQAVETFDLICAFDLIEHFGKDEILEVLRLIWERLKPGASFVLQTPNALSPWAAHYRYGDLTHEVIYSPECIASTLRLGDFSAIEIREVGPYVHGLKSSVRWLLWRLISAGCAMWNLSETGSRNGGIYTRNMIVRAVKAP